MTQFIEPPQRGATITYEGVTDEEFQVWMEEISDCVNNIEPVPPSDNTIIINGQPVGDLTLDGRSTEYTESGGVAEYTHFENFSYTQIPAGETLLIRENQTMLLNDGFEAIGDVELDENASIDFTCCDDESQAFENVGAGAEVYKEIVANSVKFRTFINSLDLNFTQDEDDISGSLSLTGVAAGTYTNPSITVDNKGRIVSAANGSSGSVITFFQVQDDGVTGQLTTNAPVTLTGIWDTPSLTSPNFSWDGSTGVLTVNASGVVEFDIKTTSWQNANNRHELHVQIFKNGSSVIIEDSQYASRNNNQDEGSAYINGFKDSASINDTYEFRVFDVGVAATIGAPNVAGETYVSVKHYV